MYDMRELKVTYTIDLVDDDPMAGLIYDMSGEAVLELQNALLEALREDLRKFRERGRATSLQDFSFKPY